MGSSTDNKTSQVYEIAGFYPFNGVTMWKRKISIYKSFHKNYFFLFFVKIKLEKSQCSRQMKLNIYSKHSSNKAKTKRKKTKVVLGNKKDLSPVTAPKRCCTQGHTEWLEDFCHVIQVCEKAVTLFGAVAGDKSFYSRVRLLFSSFLFFLCLMNA